MADSVFPDGLSEEHAAARPLRQILTSLLPLIVLGALMALALSGVLGGGKTPARHVDFGTATLDLSVPERLRNGVFFEMRADIVARVPIGDLKLAISPGLWRDMTVNTMIPAASEETFENDEFRFSYGALKAGDTLAVKIDGQINPPLTWQTRGKIALYDGERRIGSVPVTIRIIP